MGQTCSGVGMHTLELYQHKPPCMCRDKHQPGNNLVVLMQNFRNLSYQWRPSFKKTSWTTKQWRRPLKDPQWPKESTKRWSSGPKPPYLCYIIWATNKFIGDELDMEHPMSFWACLLLWPMGAQKNSNCASINNSTQKMQNDILTQLLISHSPSK